MATNSKQENVIDEFNKHPEWLFLLSWNRFSFAHPLKSKLISLDEKGFSLEVESKKSIFNSAKVKSTNVHSFSPDETKATSVQSMHSVIEKYSFPTWPAGGIHSIGLWLMVTMCAFDLGSLESKLYWIKHFAMMIFRSNSVAFKALIAMAGLHVLETVYALYILAPIIKSSSAMCGWAVVNFIFGYPSTVRAMKLSALANKMSKKAE